MSDVPDWSELADTTTMSLEIPLTRTLPAEPEHREQLLVVLGDQPGRTFPIDDEVVIGRGGDCTVALDETSVSRRHARITRAAGGGLRLHDLGSRNGTLVNGVRADSHPLTIGDRIQIGPKVVLLVTHEDPLKEILHERQKMEAIGRLAAGVAHDFNNLSAAALAMCDELEAELRKRSLMGPGIVSECLRDLRVVLERGTDLTGSLSRLGRRKSSASAEVVDLVKVCEEVARLCERTFGPTIEIRRRWGFGLRVRAHRTELHQILLNLCLNARDAMAGGGKLRISAERGSGVVADGRDTSAWVLLRVADTGAGMDKKTQSRIFDAFFTTKLEGRGTGLGLATVRELVQGMGGRIEVESTLGRGSVFRVWLPADTSAPEERPLESRPKTPSGARAPSPGLVMLVEDEIFLRRSVARLLEAAGYEVMTAGDGTDAVRSFETAAPRPGLVLLDLDLPVMGGEETLARLRDIDPEVKVLVVSGHWDPDRQAALIRAGADGFVAKPFEWAALRARIAELLEERATPRAP